MSYNMSLEISIAASILDKTIVLGHPPAGIEGVIDCLRKAPPTFIILNPPIKNKSETEAETARLSF